MECHALVQTCPKQKWNYKAAYKNVLKIGGGSSRQQDIIPLSKCIEIFILLDELFHSVLIFTEISNLIIKKI